LDRKIPWAHRSIEDLHALIGIVAKMNSEPHPAADDPKDRQRVNSA
jgi:hypothetical protein